MLKRVSFALKKAMLHQQQLKNLPYAPTIAAIDWQSLYQAGIRVVVLDFDGVLAADKKNQLQASVHAVLAMVQTIFGEHIYILSNQPTQQRQDYFAKHFPRIQFLVAKQKPYPDGLLTVIAREQVSASSIVLVDDRILTGGLATVLAGTTCILIEKPYCCFQGNVLREVFFNRLRALERLFF